MKINRCVWLPASPAFSRNRPTASWAPARKGSYSGVRFSHSFVGSLQIESTLCSFVFPAPGTVAGMWKGLHKGWLSGFIKTSKEHTKNGIKSGLKASINLPCASCCWVSTKFQNLLPSSYHRLPLSFEELKPTLDWLWASWQHLSSVASNSKLSAPLPEHFDSHLLKGDRSIHSSEDHYWGRAKVEVLGI